LAAEHGIKLYQTGEHNQQREPADGKRNDLCWLDIADVVLHKPGQALRKNLAQRGIVKQHQAQGHGQEIEKSIVAGRWLNMAEVSRAIEDQRTRMLRRTDISIERTLREVAYIGYFNPKALYRDGRALSIEELPEEVARGLTAIEEEISDAGSVLRKVRFNKMPALEALMRALGLFDEDARRRRQAEELAKDKPAMEAEFTREITDEERVQKAIRVAQILQDLGVVPTLEQPAIDVTPTPTPTPTNGKVNGKS
jgi:hypothetical protein